ncbi:MAG: flagellar basal-body rod protein FlgF [Candidatus Coatesbacteria bacterium]|nr:flagellar basal-body rod protein FlgF [Candidatus Coatesbacteria bacterium]
MIKGLYEAASGLLAEARAHEIRSNNLANVNTVGFKKDTPFFRILTHEVPRSGSSAAYDPQRASCVVVGGTVTDFSQGPLRQTDNPLDFAIQGDGFFVVNLGDKQGYTRAGTFKIGPGGEIVDQNGFPVQAGQGGLAVSEGAEILVDSNGEVFADGNSVGRLRLVTFQDKSVLNKAGANIWVAKTDEFQPQDATDAEVHQGFLESSNANVIEEMVSMIEGMRLFESHQKSIRSLLDDTVGKTINTLPNLR